MQAVDPYQPQPKSVMQAFDPYQPQPKNQEESKNNNQSNFGSALLKSS